jgi:hypothetical protein
MPSAFLARDANVAYDTTYPTPSDQNTTTLAPDPIQFLKEVLVILEVAHLAVIAARVFF